MSRWTSWNSPASAGEQAWKNLVGEASSINHAAERPAQRSAGKQFDAGVRIHPTAGIEPGPQPPKTLVTTAFARRVTRR